MASYRSSSAPNTDRKVPSDAWCQAHTYLPPSIMPVWTHQDFVDDNKTGEISLTPMDWDGCYRTSGKYTDASGGVGGWMNKEFPERHTHHYFADGDTYAAWTTNPMKPHEFHEQQLL